MSELGWIAAPLAGCLIAVGILGYLGLHVLRRQVIFVDLALAQIAALGATYAFFLGFPPESLAASAFSLLFCFGGAALFAATRAQEGRLPQEAIIGICYVVAAAAAVLLVDLARDPHGAERIRFLLVGSIVWAKWAEIGVAAAVCGGVGLFHYVFRDRFELATADPDALRAAGSSLVLWDLLFYASFGLAITAIVRLVGVLLVFSYLIIPGAVASLFAQSVRGRLITTWSIGAAVSVVGLLFGYEHPPGPVIVACFGVVLAVALMARSALDASNPAQRALQLAGGATLLVVVFLKLPSLVGGDVEHGHEDESGVHHHVGDVHHDEEEDHPAADAGLHHHPELAPPAGEGPALSSSDPLTRQEAIDRLAADESEASTALLVAHLPKETDEELQLRIATALHRRGQDEGHRALEALAAGAEVPFVRLSATSELDSLPAK
ncbi:MAG: metal ABC transporter permease [Proteobacteria bacterium]|nr:metal ABC transporter permease [Pseudomonadota bacterium]